jgi:hypothetical protein
MHVLQDEPALLVQLLAIAAPIQYLKHKTAMQENVLLSS